jgi:hypothetical protein
MGSNSQQKEETFWGRKDVAKDVQKGHAKRGRDNEADNLAGGTADRRGTRSVRLSSS